MRILVVSHGFPPHAQGGAEIYAHEHALAFARAGDKVLVLTREAIPHARSTACAKNAATASRSRG